MMEWVRRFFGGQTSSSTAKERLRLVLMTDHLALAPEIIENMKRDLVDVISRYVEVDRSKVEVNFEREDRALAMLANIPIVAVNRPAASATAVAPPVEDDVVEAEASAPIEDDAASQPVDAIDEIDSDEEPEAVAVASATTPPTRKRRRRKAPAKPPSEN